MAQILWLTGDVTDLNRYWQQIDQVTPADVQRVAQQTFQERGMTEVTVEHAADAAPPQTHGGSQR